MNSQGSSSSAPRQHPSDTTGSAAANPLGTEQVLDLVGELESRLGALKQWQRENQRHVDQLTAQDREVQGQRGELKRKVDYLSHRRDRLRQMRAAIGQRRTELENREKTFAAREARLTNKQTKLNNLQDQIGQRQSQLGSQIAQFKEDEREFDWQRETYSGHIAELERQHAELTQREEALCRREEALGHGSQELKTLSFELENKRTDIEQQQRGAHAQREMLADQAAQLNKLHCQVESGRAELDDRKVRLEQLRDDLTRQQAQQVEQGQAELTGLEEMGADMKQREHKLAENRADMARASRKVDDEKDKLKEQAKQLRTQSKKIDSRIVQLKQADAATISRQKRVHRYRELLRIRSHDLDVEKRNIQSLEQQYQGLLQQRRMLIDVKHFLETSESHMIRRWAVHKMATLVITAVLALCALAAVSYQAGQRLAQPVWRATAVVELPDIAGIANSASLSAAQWLAQCKQLTLSDAVMAETTNQLKQRGIQEYENAATLHASLVDSITMSPGISKQIEIQLWGSDKQMVVYVLESVTRAILSHQVAKARALNRQSAARIVKTATRDAQPLEDKRIALAMQIFVGAVVLAIVAGAVVWFMLRRASSVFDDLESDDLTHLETESSWPGSQVLNGPGDN